MASPRFPTVPHRCHRGLYARCFRRRPCRGHYDRDHRDTLPRLAVRDHTQPPASVTAGSGFGLTATIEDQYGNVETTDNSDVVTAALASNPGGTTLGGTLSLAVSQGVATFSSLTLTKAAAGYTIGISGISPGQSNFEGRDHRDPRCRHPGRDRARAAGQRRGQRRVWPGRGHRRRLRQCLTSANNTVKLALANNPTGAKLGGTLSVKASKGVATFSGLTLNKVGSGYTLQLTSSGLTSAVTNSIMGDHCASDRRTIRNSRHNRSRPVGSPLVLDSLTVSGGLTTKKHRPVE